jgi:hypothetical protein
MLVQRLPRKSIGGAVLDLNRQSEALMLGIAVLRQGEGARYCFAGLPVLFRE